MADVTISGAGNHASAAATDRIPASKAGVKGYLTATQIADFVEGRASLAELIRDTIGSALTAGTNITLTVNDAGDTITVNGVSDATLQELARDTLGTALTAGAGISLSVNDGADTITITCSISQYTDEMARDAIGACLVAGSGFTFTVNDGADTITLTGSEVIIIGVGDETTAITTGNGKVTFRMPFAMTLTAVRASLSTAQASGSIFTVDINEAGVSILSTKLTIDNTEKTTTTAATPAVISDSSLADDAEITIDVDQVGDGTAKGPKVMLIGRRT